MNCNEKRLALLRTEINTVDDAIVSLLVQRMQISESIGQEKRSRHIRSMYQPMREEEVLTCLRKRAPELADSVIAIWREIFSASRRIQDTRPVAVCGPWGGTVHMAARLALGHGIFCTVATTAEEAEQHVLDGSCCLAVVPEPFTFSDSVLCVCRVSLATLLGEESFQSGAENASFLFLASQ